MSYTALAKMRELNCKKYGVDIGPKEPPLFQTDNLNDLKSAALRFLHDSCEGLKFNAEIEAEENRTGEFKGTSIKPNQIPFNMQQDINRLCLERCLGQFIDSGAADDAYLVYYCFLEMFLGHYGHSKYMVELLSEYESNGSSLLMKHRDHYSHSVYVFTLGLAVYETNDHYRNSFKNYYESKLGKQFSKSELANIFLEYWGLTSLFHDIGYPFELPFEQVMSYFEVNKHNRGGNNPYIAYFGLETLTDMSEAETEHFEALYGRKFKSVFELFAFEVAAKLGTAYGFSEEDILNTIVSKASSPNKFGYYMDHALFSSVMLYKELVNSLGADKVSKLHVDSLSAMLLHNSMFKFSIVYFRDPVKRKQPLDVNLHPIAWLLMLCDELQCWDRTAYGRNSRTELHPMGAEFDFSNNSLKAIYYYDKDEQDKILAFKDEYSKWETLKETDEPPRLKAYSDMAEKEQRFKADIDKIIDLSIIPLTVEPNTREVDRKIKHIFLSNSNFLHLFDFAVSIHGRNKGPDVSIAELERQFEALSLEYQLYTINRAKNFSRYLDKIDCFYTDKIVDYAMVTEFTPEQTAVFAPMEHERWILDHQAMGWTYGTLYETVGSPEGSGKRREQMRCHKLVLDGELTEEIIQAHYDALSEEDKGKDWKPFNVMLKLLKRFDGLRIYKLE